MKSTRLSLLLVLLALSWLPLVTRAQPPTAPKRVLVVFWYDKSYPGHQVWEQGFQSTLKSNPSNNIEYYPEYLEANRFPGENQSQILRDFLKQKYADRSIDVVVAQTEASLNFLLKYRDDLFPQVPIVFYSASKPLASELAVGNEITGVVVISSYKSTLDLALSLFPNLNQVFVVSGTLAHDKRLELMAREELRDFEGQIKINYLTDLSPNELTTRTASLPEHSIVLYAWQQYRDDQGKVWENADILGSISKTSAVPIFGMSAPLLGKGIVGGQLRTIESSAGRVAELVQRIANGERAKDIPIQHAPTVPMFDWRELQRWKIREESLPPGSIIQFKEPTFWSLYKWYIIGLTSACVLEALLIAWLLFMSIRRRQAVKERERLALIVEEQHRNLDEVVSNVPGVVWEVRIDPVTGKRKTTYVSEYAKRMLGYDGDDFLSNAGFGLKLVHQDDRDRVNLESEAALSGRGGSFQFRWIAKDGRLVWVETHLAPILDEAGTTVGMRGVTLDITEQKISEEARVQSEKRNRAILRAVPDLMFLQNREGVYLDCHAQRQSDFFVPPEEFIGKNMRDVLPPDLASGLAKCLERAEEDKPQILEYELSINGAERWFEARVVRSGENVLSVVRDVTARKSAESALKQNQAQLAGIIGSAMDGIITINDQQAVVLFNAAAEKMFRCSAEEAIGQSIDRFLPERVRMFSGTNGSNGNGKGATGTPHELYGRRSNGEEFPLEASISQLELSGQKYYTVILRDVTERKRAEEQRRESESRFRMLADSSPVLIWVNGLNGCEFVNRSYLDFLGRSMDDVLSMDWTTALHPEDVEHYTEAYQRAFDNRQPFEEQFRFLRADGEYRWFKSYGVPRFTFDDTFLGYVGSSVDVTDIKDSEEALRQSEERFRNMADTAPVMIWVAGTDRLCNYFSKPWLEFTGRSLEEELENGWTESVHPDDYAQTLETFSSAFDKREPFKMEYRLRRADGQYRWVFVTGTPRFASEGEFVGFIGSCMDLTDRKEAEEELKRAHTELGQLKNQLEAENIYLQQELQLDQAFGEIVGQSDPIKYVLSKISQVSPTDATVLISGETGTGKELVARAIHGGGARKDRPLIKVNCAALSASLIESELFGHEKGAFTGAATKKLGRFELADCGTIFLDEIGELPLELQVKLLRVLQEGEFERVGGSKTLKVDVRIIAATNRNLKFEVDKGNFREDLWYRLNVFPITVPPLRQRKEDIPLMVDHFASKFAKRLGKTITSVSPRSMHRLQSHAWPGNVRELANVIERAVIHTQGSVLHLSDSLEQAKEESPAVLSLEDMERDYIIRTLENTGWRVEGPYGAAKILGLNASTLRARMGKFGIHRPRAAAQGSEVS